MDQDGLATRFSFRVEPDNSALADFFTKFATEYKRAAGRPFRNLDDGELVRVPVLDWSEQVNMPH
jgi:predicted SnoaL-like aldol condensation-catalyzing enzyme